MIGTKNFCATNRTLFVLDVAHFCTDTPFKLEKYNTLISNSEGATSKELRNLAAYVA